MKQYIKPIAELYEMVIEDVLSNSGGYGNLGSVDGDIDVNGNIWG